MIDTCQANTMYSKFYSPNILATGSSELGESSYSVRPLFLQTRRQVLNLMYLARKRLRHWGGRYRRIYPLRSRIHGEYQ